MSDIEIIVKDFCRENGLSVKLSYDMPSGYETAYGTYDITVILVSENIFLLSPTSPCRPHAAKRQISICGRVHLLYSRANIFAREYNTLFLNVAILKDAPKYEVLFYLFHELRHAMQYLCPAMFDEQIQESRFYVVLYNGVCFKLVDNQWQECILEGSEDYFIRAYMSLPYELDANAFAYEKTKEICGDTAELQELYSYWMPNDRFDYDEHKKVFCLVDDTLSKKG